MKTKYSHAFFVGSFNGNLMPEQLSAPWEHTCNNDLYQAICTTYYKGHIDAMLEVDQDKPVFLHLVSHYKLPFEMCEPEEGVPGRGKRMVLQLTKNQGKTEFDYEFYVSNLHFYFFPLNIVLFAIEIDDSGVELDDLTAAHSTISGWNIKKFADENFRSLFDSVKMFLPENDLVHLLGAGNKFKIYQTIQLETETIEDTLLYEIGTSSPIGCVGTDHWLAPSEAYYREIIRHNSISVFRNWKGLGLVDSFTMLTNDENPNGFVWNRVYFPLIYLRCIVEKTFCFSRNTSYRLGNNPENLAGEIAEMERYYFYDNISYNFLPNLLYKTMANGLGIKEEREELSRQVKEQAMEERARKRDMEERRTGYFQTILSIFAVFSISWDFLCLLNGAFVDKFCLARIVLSVGLISILVLLYVQKRMWK